ncbi:hypothetical protein WL1483_518 [Aeromonas schubertii]|uniref:Uncharacterized protein n=1 Tax=Aeromonas schubertii TaxID=652 RepID=A0A0S2SE23_9GAMM|nr:hypothetical protein WL1483_518 [Aeromonas schubertii]
MSRVRYCLLSDSYCSCSICQLKTKAIFFIVPAISKNIFFFLQARRDKHIIELFYLFRTVIHADDKII